MESASPQLCTASTAAVPRMCTRILVYIPRRHQYDTRTVRTPSDVRCWALSRQEHFKSPTSSAFQQYLNVSFHRFFAIPSLKSLLNPSSSEIWICRQSISIRYLIWHIGFGFSSNRHLNKLSLITHKFNIS